MGIIHSRPGQEDKPILSCIVIVIVMFIREGIMKYVNP